MKEIEFSRWLYELPVKYCSQFCPSGSTFLPCISLPSKSHRENSISSTYLESPHQVDMKNVVKSSKYFFGYFNTLETHSGLVLKPVTSKLFFSTIWMLCPIFVGSSLINPIQNLKNVHIRKMNF